MHRVGLKAKFAILFIAMAAVLLLVNAVWHDFAERERMEREMLESARMLATEMDAVWDFMEINQEQFIRNPDGTYNVYCVVAAKVVAQRFTNESDGIVIHYTNTSTRRVSDAPDEFELEALEALRADSGIGAYYGLVDYGGGQAFRYVQPLYATESCLECHGGPAGELDVMGYPKEGLEKGDLAGAASIIIPADTYLAGAGQEMARETFVFFLLIACCLLAAFYGISRLVTRPLAKIKAASVRLECHDFDVDLSNVGKRDEVEDLARSFGSMAQELKGLYEGLESEVEARTAQLRETNEALERQRAELEAVNRVLMQDNELKEDFLATVSHELRTPLTSILAFADLWERADVPRSETEAKMVAEMKISSQVLLSMVNNMLDLTRVEAGRAEIEIDPVDPADLLAEARDSVLFLANRKGVDVSIAVEGDVPVVMADGYKLRRILENLASNAVKFTDEGGSVRLSARLCEGDVLALVVADNGRGMAQEDVPLLFERFVRGSGSSSVVGRSYGSSGLGLALVRDLVSLLGGTVDVRSTVGEGSEFEVRVPVDLARFACPDDDAQEIPLGQSPGGGLA